MNTWFNLHFYVFFLKNLKEAKWSLEKKLKNDLSYFDYFFNKNLNRAP